MRKKNDKFNITTIIRVYGMRTIYVHKVMAKISQQNELKKFPAFQLLDWTNSASMH